MRENLEEKGSYVTWLSFITTFIVVTECWISWSRNLSCIIRQDVINRM